MIMYSIADIMIKAHLWWCLFFTYSKLIIFWPTCFTSRLILNLPIPFSKNLLWIILRKASTFYSTLKFRIATRVRSQKIWNSTFMCIRVNDRFMASIFKFKFVVWRKSRMPLEEKEKKKETIKMRDDFSSSDDINAICGFVWGAIHFANALRIEMKLICMS